MGNIVQSATTILAGANARAEQAAQNIANMATPGYRSRKSFEAAVLQGESQGSALRMDMTVGKPMQTGNAFDVAITGAGFFELMGPQGPLYTRNGQFSRDEDGRLVGMGGHSVQAEGGGDIVLASDDFTVTEDGTILEDQAPIARLALLDSDSLPALAADGTFAFPGQDITPVERRSVSQSFLESSNVSLGDEMTVLMEAVRRAETGQRLMNVYDDLMGRVITTFGQTGA